MKNKKQNFEMTEERVNPRLEREKKIRQEKLNGLMTVLDRIFGFMLVTALVVLIAGIGVVYVLTKGPSESLRDEFVMTMLETRRFDFMSRLFLTSEEVSEIRNVGDDIVVADFDSSLISITSADAIGAAQMDTAQFAQDDDGDGIIFEEIKGPGYAGYMITVLDPTRVLVGMPDTYGGVGLTLEEMVNKYGALGGINAGGFKDEGGSGLGGQPEGLTIVDGVCYGDGSRESVFVGLDDKGIMHVGYYTAWSAEVNNIKNGVSFGPVLIMNGQAVNPDSLPSGVNPRTAIGQRSDGAILMLVIDGRQAHSMGATYQDCMEIMLSKGAVNAINMDGGSSTSMYYNGEYVNRNSSTAGARPLPTAFLFR